LNCTPKTDIDYLNKFIEIDAIAFANHQMKILFENEVSIPEEIKDAVFLRIKSLK